MFFQTSRIKTYTPGHYVRLNFLVATLSKQLMMLNKYQRTKKKKKKKKKGKKLLHFFMCEREGAYQQFQNVSFFFFEQVLSKKHTKSYFLNDCCYLCLSESIENTI